MMLKKTLLSLAMLAAATVTASPLDFLCDACGDGCFEVGGEALYWKPCASDWTFGQVSGAERNAVNGAQLAGVKNTYDWGFRVFGGYHSCDGCESLQVSWHHLETSDHSFFADPTNLELRVLEQSPSTIGQYDNLDEPFTAKAGFRYNRASVRAFHRVGCGCRTSFSVFGGARYINLVALRSMRFEESNDLIVFLQRSKAEGVGIEVGANWETSLCGDLSLVGEAGLLGAVVDRKGSYLLRDTDTNINSNSFELRSSSTACLPGADVRLGLRYTKCCGCIQLQGEVGYELQHYWNGMAWLHGYREGNNFIAEDVGFGGPYFRIAGRF